MRNDKFIILKVNDLDSNISGDAALIPSIALLAHIVTGLIVSVILQQYFNVDMSAKLRFLTVIAYLFAIKIPVIGVLLSIFASWVSVHVFIALATSIIDPIASFAEVNLTWLKIAVTIFFSAIVILCIYCYKSTPFGSSIIKIESPVFEEYGQRYFSDLKELFEYDKIYIIDTILISLVTYVLVGFSLPDMTAFQTLLIAIIAGLFFLVLMEFETIRKILPFCGGLLWTAIILKLLPFESWNSGNLILAGIIGSIVFLISFQTHKKRVASSTHFFKNNYTYRGYKTYKAHPSVSSVFSSFTTRITTYIASFKNFFHKSEKIYVYQQYYPRYNAAKTNFESIRSQVSGGKWVFDTVAATNSLICDLETIFSNPNATIPKEQIPEFEAKIERIETATKNLIYYQSQQTAHQSSNRQSHTEEQHRNTNTNNNRKDDSIDESLFNGCTDKESVTKRYRQLMKTFHPDNQNGDQVMTQKIQNTYEKMLARY